MVVEQMLVVLGADFFEHLLLHPPISPDRRPGLIESVGILHPDVHFQHLTAVGQFPALRDVELLGVRRAVRVDDGLAVLPDGVDYERVAFVVPDRLAVL